MQVCVFFGFIKSLGLKGLGPPPSPMFRPTRELLFYSSAIALAADPPRISTSAYFVKLINFEISATLDHKKI